MVRKSVSGDAGSLTLEQALIVALFVLASAATLVGLGKAIACTFSQESASIGGEFIEGCGQRSPEAMLGHIAFLFTDGESGDAVPAANVTLTQGRFVADGSGGGTYTYTATSPGYVPQEVTVPVDASGVAAPVRVAFVPEPIDYTVTAIDRDSGEPLVGGTVTLVDSLGAAAGRSPLVADAQGQAVFSVSHTDTYTITATKAGYLAETTQVYIEVGGVVPSRSYTVAAKTFSVVPGTVRVTLRIWGDATVEHAGSVTDLSDPPVLSWDFSPKLPIPSGTVVLTRGSESFTAQADSNGVAVFSGMEPGSYSIHVFLPDFTIAGMTASEVQYNDLPAFSVSSGFTTDVNWTFEVSDTLSYNGERWFLDGTPSLEVNGQRIA